MRLDEVVAVSRSVAGTAGRLEKVGASRGPAPPEPPDELPIVIPFLSGESRQGRIGIGGAALAGLREVPPADAPRSSSAKSTRCSIDSRRLRAPDRRPRAPPCCGSLLGRGDARRAGFSRPAALRRAPPRGARRRADGRRRARVAGSGGAHPARGDARRRSGAGRPHGVDRGRRGPGAVHPAAVPTGAADAGRFGRRCRRRADALGEASFEYKLDGARIQVHKVGRRGEACIRGPARRDSRRAGGRRRRARDAGAIDRCSTAKPSRCGPTARRIPFQDTMRRFGRKLDVDRLRDDAADHADVLRRAVLDGDPLVDEPLTRRVALLEEQLRRPNLRAAGCHRRSGARPPRSRRGAGGRVTKASWPKPSTAATRRDAAAGVAEGETGADARSRGSSRSSGEAAGGAGCSATCTSARATTSEAGS